MEYQKKSLTEIADALGGLRFAISDTKMVVCCPAHEDTNPSLSITDEGDKRLVYCHAGCSQERVIEALSSKGLWDVKRHSERAVSASNGVAIYQPEKLSQQAKKQRGLVNMQPPQKVAEYNYTDEKGRLLYQVVRYKPKSFRQRCPDGAGGWIYKLNDVRRVLYNLPKVLSAIESGEIIYIVEGEKDVDNLRELALLATCSAMGADNGSGTKWLPEFRDYFIGADVIIIPDNDAPGMKHANYVYSQLKSVAKSICIALVPKPHKDASDYIAAGASREDFERLEIVQQASDEPLLSVDEINAQINTFDLSDFDGELLPQSEASQPPIKKSLIAPLLSECSTDYSTDWLVEDYFIKDTTCSVYGEPGCGKSFLAIDLACSLATGQLWHSKRVDKSKVVYIAGEGINGLNKRFMAWCKGNNRPASDLDGVIRSSQAIVINDKELIAEFVRQADALLFEQDEVGMVVIDTLARNFVGDENSAKEMGEFINCCDLYLRAKYKCAVVIIHHTGLQNKERARGSSSLRAALDCEYQVENKDGIRSLVCTKMKDEEPQKELYFGLTRVELGFNRRWTDKVQSSCYIQNMAQTPEQVLADFIEKYAGGAVKSQLTMEELRLSQNEEKVVKAMQKLDKEGMRRNHSRKDIIAKCTIPNINSQISRYLASLVEKGRITKGSMETYRLSEHNTSPDEYAQLSGEF